MALVVTIVILIILATISITAVIGENGIIQKAQKAKEVYANSTKTEEDAMETLLEKIDEIGAIANVPNVKKFNKANTYYVRWEEANSDNMYEIRETSMTSSAPANWYNYEEKKWANIKTTGGGNECYWVWIPRYAYKVPTKPTTNGTVQEKIEVKFLQGTSNNPTDGTNINLKTDFTTAPTAGEWVVHPAFTNGGNGGFGELTGIWVAKYEASSSVVKSREEDATQFEADLASTTGTNAYGGHNTTTLKVRVRPEVTSWRGINVSNIFTVCQNLTTAGNSLEGTQGLDAHMLKNTEWGATAYLSASQYGKATPVWNNGYCWKETNYADITGYSSASQNGVTVMETAGIPSTEYSYNTTKGVEASTTGNVYGVYDMAGGAWEYVAGYLNEVLANDATYRGYSQALYSAEPKYKDIYAGTGDVDHRADNYNSNTGKYGDAMYETSITGIGMTGWNDDYSNFTSSAGPVFARGGRTNAGAGVFAFSSNSSGMIAALSFRPCVVVQ